jgi:SRSO17 transposase
LARDAQPTVAITDKYSAEYKDLFKEVRNYECFKYLHLGIMSPIKRKSLPEIAKVVSINSAQSLHYFLANSDWSVDKLPLFCHSPKTFVISKRRELLQIRRSPAFF